MLFHFGHKALGLSIEEARELIAITCMNSCSNTNGDGVGNYPVFSDVFYDFL